LDLSFGENLDDIKSQLEESTEDFASDRLDSYDVYETDFGIDLKWRSEGLTRRISMKIIDQGNSFMTVEVRSPTSMGAADQFGFFDPENALDSLRFAYPATEGYDEGNLTYNY
jgi:hypothetical protein